MRGLIHRTAAVAAAAALILGSGMGMAAAAPPTTAMLRFTPSAHAYGKVPAGPQRVPATARLTGTGTGVTTRPCTTSSFPGTGSRDPFRGVCKYLAHRGGVVQVALFDRDNGTTYLLSTGDDIQYTASIVKVDIVAKWLHHYQGKAVTIPGGIPFSIRYLMQQAIEISSNEATTGLFYFGGGCRALTAFNDLIPLTHTTVACETPTYYGWGNTTTTAADQAALMKIIAYRGRDDIVGSDARRYALQLMQSVVPDQRFGITCGPWGTTCKPPNYASPRPGVTVALKNGWKPVPTCTKPAQQCPWQVNSMGWVAGRGRNYVLAVLTTNNPPGHGRPPRSATAPEASYGIDTIQGISKRIWANLP